MLVSQYVCVYLLFWISYRSVISSLACPANCASCSAQVANIVCDTCNDGYYMDADKVCQSELKSARLLMSHSLLSSSIYLQS